ncbi:hypothetical protein SDC9_209072 [bioreactor metagenome]|uniref:Uncharacterized protein n=1 Tax=bioreactor metagenome TaxID=1076179 RepID=A0A645JD07_9ZZZZ
MRMLFDCQFPSRRQAVGDHADNDELAFQFYSAIQRGFRFKMHGIKNKVRIGDLLFRDAVQILPVLFQDPIGS